MTLRARFGSEADIKPNSDDVRFTPESGRGSARSRCPLRAKSGPRIAAKNPAGGAPSRPNVRAAASTSFALKDEIHQELKRGDREKACANGRRQYGSRERITTRLCFRDSWLCTSASCFSCACLAGSAGPDAMAFTAGRDGASAMGCF